MSANRWSEFLFAPEKYKLTALYVLCLVGGSIGVGDGVITSGKPIRGVITLLSGLMTLSLVFYLARTRDIRSTTLLACVFTAWVFLSDFILYADPYYLAIGFSVPISAAFFLRMKDAIGVLLVYGLFGLSIGMLIHSGWLCAHYPAEEVTVRTITALAIISAMAGPTILMQSLLARSEEREFNQRVRFETVCDIGYGALCEANDDGRIVYVRGRLLGELGYRSSQVLGHSHLDFVHPSDRFAVLRLAVGKRPIDYQYDHEIRILDAGGRERWVRLSGGACQKSGGKTMFVFALQDIHDAVEHRKRMFELSRLQSLGNLCGGLAHDFNNLLTVIGVHASGIADDESRNKILSAQQQAADLTAGLLTFARKQSFREQSVELREFLRSSRELIEKLLPANIRCQWNLESDARVRVDPAQLQQVLLNVVANSQQALPDGGLITVNLDTISLSEESATEHEIARGEYASLTVSDDGHGMDAETASRSIEPFFTTKPRGVGTGLGLSTAHGTAKRAGGALVVSSQLNYGTDVTMLLPLVQRTAIEIGDTGGDFDEEVAASGCPIEESLDVVLVEDHPIVATTIEEMLEDCGHRVRVFGDAETAMKDIHDDPQIDLLVTDVMLPGMSGVELVTRALRCYADLRCILISGYLTDDLDIVSANPDSIRMLPKPFCREQLETVVGEICFRHSRVAA